MYGKYVTNIWDFTIDTRILIITYRIRYMFYAQHILHKKRIQYRSILFKTKILYYHSYNCYLLIFVFFKCHQIILRFSNHTDK